MQITTLHPQKRRREWKEEERDEGGDPLPSPLISSGFLRGGLPRYPVSFHSGRGKSLRTKIILVQSLAWKFNKQSKNAFLLLHSSELTKLRNSLATKEREKLSHFFLFALSPLSPRLFRFSNSPCPPSFPFLPPSLPTYSLLLLPSLSSSSLSSLLGLLLACLEGVYKRGREKGMDTKEEEDETDELGGRE